MERNRCIFVLFHKNDYQENAFKKSTVNVGPFSRGFTNFVSL